MIAIALGTGRSMAQEKPTLLPSRDVDITYRVTLPGEPKTRERARWLAADGLERVDGPSNTTTIFDRKAHYITVLRRKSHSYLKLSSPARGPIEPDPNTTVTAGGDATVAGLSCKVWNWVNPEDLKPHSFCATDDGVLLRVTVDGQTIAQATSVQFRKLKPETFTVPPGYEPSLASEGDAP